VLIRKEGFDDFQTQQLIGNIKYFINFGYIETAKKLENGFKRIYFEKNIID